MLYTVRIELAGMPPRTPAELADILPEDLALVGQGSASARLVVVATVDTPGPMGAVAIVVERIRKVGLTPYAVEAVPTEEWDRQNP